MFDSLATSILSLLEGWGWLQADSHLGQALHFFIMDVTKIFSLLLLIIYSMGFLRAALSPERVRDYVRGKPRWLSRLLAIVLGAITPFCSCSSVPLFVGFVEAGIPVGVTFSFLIASPMINEVAVLVLIGVLGWQLTALYVISGLVVAYVGGAIMERLHAEKWVHSFVWDVKVGSAPRPELPKSARDRHRFALAEVREILGRIWIWVLAGVGAGALFHGFVPEAWVAENLGTNSGIGAVPAAVVVGVPLYSNATGVIPVAEALLGKGVAIGTVLALMMSIAALSLPEMIILRKVVKWRGLAVYASILAVSFTLVGWMFNALT